MTTQNGRPARTARRTATATGKAPRMTVVTIMPRQPGPVVVPTWDDDTAAARFVREAVGRIALVVETGEWLSWTGTSWSRAGAEREAKALAHRICTAIRDELLEAAAEDDERSLALAKMRHNGDSEDAATRVKASPHRRAAATWSEQRRFTAVWRAAQTWTPEEGASTLLVSEDQLDARPDLLPCVNGTLDLATLTLEPSNPDHWLTRSTGTIFDPTAKHERWTQFLNEIFPDSPTGRETRAFLQRWAGGMLSGRTTDQILLLLHGQGGNGKGVFVGALQQAMGHFSKTLTSSALVARPAGFTEHSTIFTGLRGARLAVTEEISTGATWDEKVLKSLTGSDRIVARPIARNEQEWDPTHSLVVVVNSLPHVSENDDAMWARLTPVRFSASFDRTETGLREALSTPEARAAVLAWCVRGLAERQNGARGLDIPECVKVQRSLYRAREDPLTQFLAETVVKADTDLPAATLWSEWLLWSERQGVPMGAKRGLTGALEKRGWERKTLADKVRTPVWVGRGIVGREEEPF